MSMIICANMQAHMVPYIVGNLMSFFSGLHLNKRADVDSFIVTVYINQIVDGAHLLPLRSH